MYTLWDRPRYKLLITCKNEVCLDENGIRIGEDPLYRIAIEFHCSNQHINRVVVSVNLIKQLPSLREDFP